MIEGKPNQLVNRTSTACKLDLGNNTLDLRWIFCPNKVHTLINRSKLKNSCKFKRNLEG